MSVNVSKNFKLIRSDQGMGLGWKLYQVDVPFQLLMKEFVPWIGARNNACDIIYNFHEFNGRTNLLVRCSNSVLRVMNAC
jgi:hypothetical protein